MRSDDTTTESEKIRESLEQYVENLKRGGQVLPETTEDQTPVEFPDNFEEVSLCMTRGDLCDSDDTPKDISGWQSHVLLERLGEVGIYRGYRNEPNSDKTTSDQVHCALAKVAQLDRMLQRKEDKEWESRIKAESELDKIRQRVETQSAQYEMKYGVSPPGMNVGSIQLCGNQSDDTSLSTGTPSKCNRRFFMTDVHRNETPFSSVSGGNSTVKSMDAGSSMASTIGRSHSSLTKDQEARIELLVGLEDSGEIDEMESENSNKANILLSINKYGGAETADAMEYINKRMSDVGILEQLGSDDEEYGEDSTTNHPIHEDPILLQTKKTREKERMIDKALKQLAEADLPVVKRDGYEEKKESDEDIFPSFLCQEHIQRVLQEAKAEIEADCIAIASSEQVDFLLSTMKWHLRKQVAAN
mmetsp:Transcript_53211/g.159283  ORF Transcript_53211/g.159283 Transcript_53211/m.159283 type:complete len:416 (-) Transcript_53211:23-1270(-)